MADDKTNTSTEAARAPRLVPSSRFTLALLVFFAFIVQYSQRVNLPIAIVCMVNRTKVPAALGSDEAVASVRDADPDQPSKNLFDTTTTVQKMSGQIQKGGMFEEKQFLWSEFEQQLLLGGYWGGYIFTQVPGQSTLLFVHIKRIIALDRFSLQVDGWQPVSVQNGSTQLHSAPVPSRLWR